MHLVVIHPFANYVRGDRITDSEEIAKLVDGADGKPHENAHHVVKASDPA